MKSSKMQQPNTRHLGDQIGAVHRKWSQLGRDRNAEQWELVWADIKEKKD